MFDDVPQNLPTGGQVPPQPTAPKPSAPAVKMPEPPEPSPVAAPAIPKPAEDMFSGIDKETANGDAPTVVMESEVSGSGHKTLVVVIVALAVVLVLAGGAWAALKYFGKSGTGTSFEVPGIPNTTFVVPTSDADITDAERSAPPVSGGGEEIGTDVVSPEDAPQIPVAEEPAVPVLVDSDGDGLTDEEEARYGTSIRKPDTDNDGLFDREEVVVYKTNPLSADTDKDGYLDGAEVSGGYNPNGAGKLLQVP